MLILSQDKKEIVNLNNVESISIWKPIDNEKKCTIQSISNNNITLAVYDTEERAKEVLQEIIKAYIENKKSQEANSMFGYSIISNNTYYEMPEK